MEVILTIDGKEIKAQINDKDIELLKQKQKKTGYEIVYAGKGEIFHQNTKGQIVKTYACGDIEEIWRYEVGNYYSNETVANNNARVDKLMRKLRQFAALHGGCLPIKDNGYTIYLDRTYNSLHVLDCNGPIKYFGEIRFANKEAAEKAIKIFHDELLWYFIEYNPMPAGY